VKGSVFTEICKVVGAKTEKSRKVIVAHEIILSPNRHDRQ